jgi:hypothetical protein
MDMFFLTFIVSIRATISFLLLLHAILPKDNTIHLAATTIQGIQQTFHWMGLVSHGIFGG